jgi:Uma2 family endonuclease
MSSAAARRQVSIAEYLAGEQAGEPKHQLIDGEVFAMGGGSPEHAALIASVGLALGTQLRGRPCRPYASELRVGVEGLITYPDWTVVCGPLERHPLDALTILNPTFLVEVLSDGTEAFDRGRKAERYRRIPSLREYLLVSQHQRHLEVFRRTERGWVLLEAGAGGRIELESIGCRLEVDEVYEGALGPLAL